LNNAIRFGPKAAALLVALLTASSFVPLVSIQVLAANGMTPNSSDYTLRTNVTLRDADTCGDVGGNLSHDDVCVTSRGLEIPKAFTLTLDLSLCVVGGDITNYGKMVFENVKTCTDNHEDAINNYGTIDVFALGNEVPLNNYGTIDNYPGPLNGFFAAPMSPSGFFTDAVLNNYGTINNYGNLWASCNGEVLGNAVLLNPAVRVCLATTTKITPDPARIINGDAVTLTATVTSQTPPTGFDGTTSGNVSWDGPAFNETCSLTSEMSGGFCSVTTTPTAPGVTTISASYRGADEGGDPFHLSSSGSTTLSVQTPRPALAVQVSPSTLAVGGSVTGSATLTGVHADVGGAVTYEFFVGSTCSGSPRVVGSPVNVTVGKVPASSPQTIDSAGYYSWNAVYSGDGINDNATSGCRQLVVYNSPLLSVTVSCHPDSLVVGSRTTCKASVQGSSPFPKGVVTWSGNNTRGFSGLTCKLSKGACSVQFTATSAGPSTIVASYLRAPSEPPFTGAFALTATAKASKTTVSCAPGSASSASTEIVTCRAKVTGYSPTGTVSWSQTAPGSVSLSSTACTLAKGACSVSMTGTTAGQVTLQATYSGDPNNQGSSGTATLTVK